MGRSILLCVLLLLSFPIASFSATSSKQTYYLLRYPHPTAGLFSAFRYVLAALYTYENEKEKMAGLEINFAKEGLYYDPLYGDNSWEYYCEPIRFGSPEGARRGDWRIVDSCPTSFHTSRKAAGAIIAKYIRVKPHITQKVDAITRAWSENFVIGVHYRGTDKVEEVPKTRYQKVLQALDKVRGSLNVEKYKIFVATDESSFLDFMKQHFPNQVLCYEEAYRSTDGNPVHFNKSLSPYKKGEDAFIDCLLLSKCNFLIATSSHLSLCSSFFNLSLPMLLLKK